MIRPHRLAWLYVPTIATFHRIDRAHDLRPQSRDWRGLNDNAASPQGAA
jgi:hypothetical protein